MSKLVNKMNMVAIAAKNRLNKVMSEENGDTNFISILLIIAVVVVLAGAFLTVGNNAVTAIGTKIQNFINSPTAS